MLRSALQAFRARARQEVSETLTPATIRLAGGVTDLVASTAGLKRGERLGAAFFADHEITFRVRLDLLETPPAVGTRLQWVDGGNQVFRIDTVKTNSTVHVLSCTAISS